MQPLTNHGGGYFSQRQWSILAPLIVQFSILAALRSLFMPIYQKQLRARDFDPELGSFVAGFRELTFLVVFPMSVYNVQSMGSRLMFHYGNFMVGLSLILMGFVEEYVGAVVFFCLSFGLWIFQSVGAALAYMASFALVVDAFPGKAAAAYLALFVCYGGGTIVGSLLWAITADAGSGLVLVYVLAGFAAICLSYVVACCLPREDNSLIGAHDILTSIFPLACLKGLKIASTQVSSIIILSAALSRSFLIVALDNFPEQLALNTIERSLTMASLHGCALIAAVVVGLLCHRGAPPALFTVTGLVAMLSGLFSVGPVDLINIQPNWETVTTGYFTFGLGFSTTLVSVFVSLVQSAAGIEFSNYAFGHIAGIFTLSYSLGSFLGSALTGLSLEVVGLFDSATLVMLAPLFSLVLLIFHLCWGQAEMRDAINDSLVVTYGAIDTPLEQSLQLDYNADGKSRSIKVYS